MVGRMKCDGEESSRRRGICLVVVSRASLSRMVCLDIWVDGQRMGSLRSDGIILCTPVGSSGYSVSAGGPLLYPAMDAIGFTPVCPFLNTISPMVFPGSSRHRASDIAQLYGTAILRWTGRKGIN